MTPISHSVTGSGNPLEGQVLTLNGYGDTVDEEVEALVVRVDPDLDRLYLQISNELDPEDASIFVFHSITGWPIPAGVTGYRLWNKALGQVRQSKAEQPSVEAEAEVSDWDLA